VSRYKFGLYPLFVPHIALRTNKLAATAKTLSLSHTASITQNWRISKWLSTERAPNFS
jgi:hypothetical protein